MIAEGLKGNCSVTEVDLVSLGGMLVRFELLTRVFQSDNQRSRHLMSSSSSNLICSGLGEVMDIFVKLKITEGLRQGHGADKGIAITNRDGAKCLFLSFERLEQIDLDKFDFKDKFVRMLSHDMV